MYYWGFHPGVVEQSTRPLVARCGWPRLGGCQSREDNLSWGGVGAPREVARTQWIFPKTLLRPFLHPLPVCRAIGVVVVHILRGRWVYQRGRSENPWLWTRRPYGNSCRRPGHLVRASIKFSRYENVTHMRGVQRLPEIIG